MEGLMDKYLISPTLLKTGLSLRSWRDLLVFYIYKHHLSWTVPKIAGMVKCSLPELSSI